jgi:hypothetical protein
MTGELAMKTRIAGSVALAILASGVSSQVLADCCDSFWSCGAAVVTEGVSCEIQTIIDTINSLLTEINNFGNGVTGITSQKEAAARQSVTDGINTIQSQSQQASSDLVAALSQSTTIYTEEKTLIGFQTQTNATLNTLTTNPPNSVSKPPQLQTRQTASEQTPSGGNPLSMTTQRTQGVTPVATPPSSGNPTLQKSTVNAGTQVANLSAPIAAPHGTYTDAFQRGQKQIEALKAAGDADLPKVNQYLQQAQSSEGPGVAAADTLAGVMNSPITAMASELNQLLTDPFKAFDPTSIVTQMENSVTAALNANTPQMIADITAGPDQAFAAAQPTFDDLLAKAESAQQLATAMANLYRLRSPAAAEALYALLPMQQFANTVNKASSTANISLATKFGQRQPYSVIAARMATAKQKVLLVAKLPSDTKLRALATQFKAQQAQGKSPLPQSTLVSYKSNFSSQLSSYFNNKSPAAVATQRDQLIAQAHTQFAKDPTTGNAVIALVNSEAAKHGTTSNATATVTPIPGQPVPTLATQTASSFKPAATSPVNPPVSQAKAPTWGTAPATTAAPSWGPAAAGTPAATTGVQSSFKATTTLKTAQPIQQQQTQQTTMPMAAPSSMGR